MYTKRNQRRAAQLTGISLLLMAVIAGGIMTEIYAPIFNSGRADFIVHFEESNTRLIIGLFGWILILLCDIQVSCGLYVVYRTKNQRRAFLMGALRLIYSTILMIAIVQLIRAYFFSSDAEESYELILSFRSSWLFGLIIFGVHLVYLSTLVWNEQLVPKVISGALFMAGIGYIVSNVLNLIIVDYEQLRSQVEAVFILPMIVGELGLAIWLLVKGGK